MKKYICPKCLEVIDIRINNWGGYDTSYYDEMEKVNQRLTHENDTLKALVEANVRVIKQEIIKEQQENNKEADNALQPTERVTETP